MRPKKIILCVDDNEIALGMRRMLLDLRGYRVLTAGSGDEALEVLCMHDVDLVLTDLVMPGMDGYELCRRVKALHLGMRVIIISGSVSERDLTSVADAFLPKGQSSPAEILEKIKIFIVRRRGPKKASVLDGIRGIA